MDRTAVAERPSDAAALATDRSDDRPSRKLDTPQSVIQAFNELINVTDDEERISFVRSCPALCSSDSLDLIDSLLNDYDSTLEGAAFGDDESAEATFLAGHRTLALLTRCNQAGIDAAAADLRACRTGLDQLHIAPFIDLLNARTVADLQHLLESFPIKQPDAPNSIRRYIAYIADPRARRYLSEYLDFVLRAQHEGIESAIESFTHDGSPLTVLQAFNEFLTAPSREAQRQVVEACPTLVEPKTRSIIRGVLTSVSDEGHRNKAFSALSDLSLYSREPLETASRKLIEEDNRRRVTAHVYELATLQEPPQIEEFLTSHREILCDDALNILDDLRNYQESDAARDYIEQLRNLVSRAMDNGPDNLFSAELTSTQQDLLRAYKQYILIADVDERRRFLLSHSDMYSAEHAAMRNAVLVDPGAEEAWQARLDELQKCQDSGVHAAVSGLRSPLLVEKITQIHLLVDQSVQASTRELLQRCVDGWRTLTLSDALHSESSDAVRYVFNGHAHACLRLFDVTGDDSLVDAAITSWHRCIALESEKAGIEYASNIGILLKQRFERDRNRGTLDAAIAELEPAIKAWDGNALAVFGELAKSASEDFDASDLVDRALDELRAFVDSQAAQDEDLGRALFELADLELLRNEKIPDQINIESTLTYLTQAEALLDPEGDDWAACQLCRGQLFLSRFDQTRDEQWLKRAMDPTRNAVDHRSGHTAAALSQLGKIHRLRFSFSREETDLANAVLLTKESIDCTPPEKALSLALRFQNLAITLQERYWAAGNPADLDAAVDYLRKAVGHSLKSARRCETYRHNLASFLRIRFDERGTLGDIEEAIDIFEDLSEVAHQELSELLPPAQARALRSRYRTTGDRSDLDRAIETLTDHVNASVGNCAESHEVLAEILIEKAEATTDLSLDGRIVEHYRRAFSMTRKSHVDRAYRQMATLGEWAVQHGKWDVAAEALLQASEAASARYEHAAFQQNRQQVLKEMQGLTALAAFALVRTGSLAAAAQVINNGNTRQFAATSLARWSWLERAKGRGVDHLVARMESLLQQWDTYARLSAERSQFDPSDYDTIERLESSIAEVSAEIRDLAGINAQSSPSSVAEAAKALHGDGVIFLAFCEHGGCAVLLSPTGELKSNLYESVTDDVLLKTLHSYFDAYQRFQDSSNSGAWQTWISTLSRLLQWCRDEIRAPIEEAISGWKGVTIVSVGGATLLPLNTAVDAQGVCPSEISMSYLPSFDLLNVPKHSIATDERVLVVADPSPSHLPALVGARAEAQAVAKRFTKLNLLIGVDATESHVRDALPASSFVHFACHAEAFPHDPFRSRIYLAEREYLELVEIGDLDLTNLRGAVLSGCETSLPGFELLDEAIGFPATFLSRGTTCVVASNWTIPDISTAVLFARFYHLAAREDLDVRRCLRESQAWVRGARKQEIIDFITLTFGSSNGLSAEWKSVIDDVESMNSELPFEHPVHWAGVSVYGWGACHLAA